MATSKQLLGSLLFTQFLLSAIIVGVLCSYGGATITGYVSMVSYAETLALLIAASTMLINSALLFFTMLAPITGSELTAKTPFYLAFHICLALLLVGTSIAVLAIEVPRKRNMPLLNSLWNRNIASAALGIICGVVSGGHGILARNAD